MIRHFFSGGKCLNMRPNKPALSLEERTFSSPRGMAPWGVLFFFITITLAAL